MGWFTKKEEVETKQEFKPKFKLSWRPKMVSVGVTSVRVTLLDGRTFTTVVYGSTWQHSEDGNGWCRTKMATVSQKEPVVGKILYTHSYLAAQSFVQSLNSNVNTFVDDPQDINQSWVGSAVEGIIGKTQDYEIEIQEAYLEEIK